MARAYPEYEYDLDERLLTALQEEFAPHAFIANLAGKLTAASAQERNTFLRQALECYGGDLARKAIELGNKYKDRTAEVIEEVAAKTGISFPSLPQRYLEIAMLATRPEDKWKINEASTRRFTFTVSGCTFRQALVEKLGPEVPCQEACLALLNTIYRELHMEVTVGFEELAGTGCRFTCTFVRMGA
ncbi:hypothetical protein [Desulfovirgula thermocuniculi]|uniref:hypothetical protein n=1 Tax=Desulfovirgula thermocuniculi TaxID=348842 RepID=UPI0003FBC8DC|nr:hypothetical protein [Desulfovirgula thermocuniculi]